MYTLTLIYTRKILCSFYRIFFLTKLQWEGNFQTLGVTFLFQLTTLVIFTQFKASVAMLPRIVQIFWIFFIKQCPTDKSITLTLYFEYIQIEIRLLFEYGEYVTI